MSVQDCEGLAARELDRIGLDAPIDPWDVVAAYEDVEVQWGPQGTRPHVEAHENGSYTITLDEAERPERVGMALLHELAHVLLRENAVQNDDDHAWWLACAMLLPREWMLRARRRGMTPEQIVAANTHASHEAVGRRLVALSESLILWVHDVEPDDREPYRVVSPGWRWALWTPTAIEQEAMDAARAARGPIEIVGGVRAWVAADPPWLRLLCLADGEVVLPTIARQIRRGRLAP